MKVKTTSDRCEYITTGKEYDVIESDDLGFSITDDVGDVIVCLFEKDLHTGSIDWEIVVEDKP